jgi:DNA-binding NarL/FixJ family response regulator
MSAGSGDHPRVVMLGDDLLFGSKLEHAIVQAGCEAVRVPDDTQLAGPLAGAVLLTIDLADRPARARELVEELRESGALAGVRTLGYYQHVDDDTRRLALAAGFDLVVPRSRLFREGAELIRGLLAGEQTAE